MIQRTRLLPVVVALLSAALLAGSGCARAKAKTAPDAPPLDMPAPPPRDVETTEAEPPAPVALPTEPARNAPPRPRPSTAQPPRTTEPREAPKPEAPTPVIETPKPPEEPPKPPPSTLQTTPAQAEGEVERTIRATLSKANADLSRIDYRVLNADARNQYDTAKSFMRQADSAIRAKNLVFAQTVAEKAAALAAQLGGK